VAHHPFHPGADDDERQHVEGEMDRPGVQEQCRSQTPPLAIVDDCFGPHGAHLVEQPRAFAVAAIDLHAEHHDVDRGERNDRHATAPLTERRVPVVGIAAHRGDGFIDDLPIGRAEQRGRPGGRALQASACRVADRPIRGRKRRKRAAPLLAAVGQIGGRQPERPGAGVERRQRSAQQVRHRIATPAKRREEQQAELMLHPARSRGGAKFADQLAQTSGLAERSQTHRRWNEARRAVAGRERGNCRPIMGQSRLVGGDDGAQSRRQVGPLLEPRQHRDRLIGVTLVRQAQRLHHDRHHPLAVERMQKPGELRVAPRGREAPLHDASGRQLAEPRRRHQQHHPHGAGDASGLLRNEQITDGVQHQDNQADRHPAPVAGKPVACEASQQRQARDDRHPETNAIKVHRTANA